MRFYLRPTTSIAYAPPVGPGDGRKRKWQPFSRDDWEVWCYDCNTLLLDPNNGDVDSGYDYDDRLRAGLWVLSEHTCPPRNLFITEDDFVRILNIPSEVVKTRYGSACFLRSRAPELRVTYKNADGQYVDRVWEWPAGDAVRWERGVDMPTRYAYVDDQLGPVYSAKQEPRC